MGRPTFDFHTRSGDVLAVSYRPGRHHAIAALPGNVLQLWEDDGVQALDRRVFERFRDLAKASENFDVPLELAVFDRDYNAIADWARLVGGEVREAAHIAGAPARFAAECAALVLRGVGEAFVHKSIGRRVRGCAASIASRRRRRIDGVASTASR